MKTYLLIFGSLVAAIALFGIGYYAHAPESTFRGGVYSNFAYDTTWGGFTQSTTTVNTTSTQLASSIQKLLVLVNNTTSTITCSLDARGTTAPSSTVTAGRGLILGPNNQQWPPSQAFIGQCQPGMQPCYPHQGAVNCVANVSSTVDKLVQ